MAKTLAVVDQNMDKTRMNKSWWNKNWKWMTLIIGILMVMILAISSTDIGEKSFDVIKAYADPDLVEIALNKAQENKEVKELLGTLKPIDNMAKLEGEVKYSDHDTSVEISVRVKGSKGKGRMRILAERIGEKWIYSKIYIGIKKPNRIIKIID